MGLEKQNPILNVHCKPNAIEAFLPLDNGKFHSYHSVYKSGSFDLINQKYFNKLMILIPKGTT